MMEHNFTWVEWAVRQEECAANCQVRYDDDEKRMFDAMERARWPPRAPVSHR